MEEWKTEEVPLISIVCVTYNHEPYIGDAINGFLMQETNFPFEVIVHDDASTDNTVDIINDYAKKFPKIIRPILQEENQYSKGRRCGAIAQSYARGDYVALCEGDDYWIDKRKLQIQIDEMQKHLECNISFHSAIKKENVKNSSDTIFCKRSDGKKVIDISRIIRCGGSFMPTASIVLRRNVVDRFVKDKEGFFYSNLTGYFVQIFGTEPNGALYIDRPMSVYRSLVEGSWTSRVRKDQKFNIYWAKKNIDGIKAADKITRHQYQSHFNAAIRRRIGIILRDRMLNYNIRRECLQVYGNDLILVNRIFWNIIYFSESFNVIFLLIIEKFVKYLHR